MTRTKRFVLFLKKPMARSDQSLLQKNSPPEPGGLFCILRAVYVPEKSPFVPNFCAGGCRPLLRLVYWVHVQALR